MNVILKLILIVGFVTSFCVPVAVFAQTPQIITGAAPLDRSDNLVVNGSFEQPHLTGGATYPDSFPLYDGIDGDGYHYWGTGTANTPVALPDNWSSTGAGASTYAIWGNIYNAVPQFSLPESGIIYSDPNIDGDRVLYFGNQIIRAISETPEFMPGGEVVFNSPPTFTPALDHGTGVVLTQTVSGLIPGRTYRMSFWVSGEYSSGILGDVIIQGDSIMGVDIEGYDRLYLTVPGGAAPPVAGEPHVFGSDMSHTYTLEFEATGSQMDISFINWGHFSANGTAGWDRGNTTELVMDDVIMNLVSEPHVVPALSRRGVLLMAALFGIAGVMFFRGKRVNA